jgi:hypothetical protein
MHTRRSNRSLRLLEGPYQFTGAITAQRREVEAGVEVEIPHQVWLGSVVLLVAVAGPDASGHEVETQALQLWIARAPVDVPEVLEVDLPVRGRRSAMRNMSVRALESTRAVVLLRR